MLLPVYADEMGCSCHLGPALGLGYLLVDADLDRLPVVFICVIASVLLPRVGHQRVDWMVLASVLRSTMVAGV